MKLFSYPLDLYTWALLAFTLFVVFAIVANKRIARTKKYLLLSLTFASAGVLGLIALYSIVLATTVCLTMTALCFVLFRLTKHNKTPKRAITVGYRDLQLDTTCEVLSALDPRPFPGTRVIGPG